MSFFRFANSLTAARVLFRVEKLTSRHTSLHRHCNNDSDFLCRLYEVIVSEVGIVCRIAIAACGRAAFRLGAGSRPT